MAARSTNTIRFEIAGTAGVVTHLSGWMGDSTGIVQFIQPISPLTLPASFEVGRVTLLEVDGSFSDDSDRVALDARIGRITHIQGHSGLPDADGNGHEIGGRLPVAFGPAVAG